MGSTFNFEFEIDFSVNLVSYSDEEYKGNLSSGDEEILSSLNDKSKRSTKQESNKKGFGQFASGSTSKFNKTEFGQKNDLGNWEKHTKGIGAKLLLKVIK